VDTDILPDGMKGGVHMLTAGIRMVASIFGMGVLLSVIDIILKKAGKEDVAFWIGLAGIVAIMFLVVPQLGRLFDEVRSIFSIF
jgi:stage III sporulation protein AC